MGRFVSPQLGRKLQGIMFGDSFKTPREQLFREEITRYTPQLIGSSDKEITEFVGYQKSICLDGGMPVIGRPIASPNPRFVDSLDSIKQVEPGFDHYVRASIKENGFRMQVHIGTQGVSAFSRQFTRFDLRMFPELSRTFEDLPVMIGDAELVNKRHKHLAGFEQVKARIPGQSHWPRRGETGIDDEVLNYYLTNRDLFSHGVSLPDMELTLVFHGLFAIADPETWTESRKIQQATLIPLYNLPIDYRKVDDLLRQLSMYISERSLNARVVEMFVPRHLKDLEEYVRKNEYHGFEGTCIVQSVWDEDDNPVVAGRSIKIKTYETVETVVQGLYLKSKEAGVVEENIIGVLVGLYDEMLGVYLPVAKVNLDPEGVQIKTEGQRKRLNELRRDIASLAVGKVLPDGDIYTLYDTFLMTGAELIKYLFKDASRASSVEAVLEEMPVRSDLLTLFQFYKEHRSEFLGQTMKQSTVVNRFISKHLQFFQNIDQLDRRSQRKFLAYFGKAKEIRRVSSKLVKPQAVLGTDPPVIIETRVFDVSRGLSPYPAGFHSWYCNSFYFNNVFVERVRYDKSSTTDFATIHAIAGRNTARVGK